MNGLLKKGNFLTSKNGKLKLILQEDGNLEILCGGHPIWSTNTYNFAIEELHFSKEGKLLIINKDKSIAKNIMSSSDNTNGAEKLILQDDGNLVLYDYNSDPLWATGTNGKCVESENIILFEELTLQTHHVYTTLTLKRTFSSHFHVEYTWCACRVVTFYFEC